MKICIFHNLLKILPLCFVFIFIFPGFFTQAEDFHSDCDLGTDDILAAAVNVQACDGENSTWAESGQIYCGGKLLEAVNFYQQLQGNDSKDFVDRPMRKSAHEIMQQFNALFANANGTVRGVTVKNLRKFLDENFAPAGGELEKCNPNDWKENPPELTKIRDDALRKWALDLNGIWRNLCKKIPEDIKDASDRHSLIYVSNPFIVPGGRFREFYYWDAFWMMKGLLVSGMTETVRLMIDNFLEMVDRFGFVPNGGRIYYSKRSQPPFLTMMVYEYFEATQDVDFLRKAVPLLEKELNFWHRERTIDVSIDGKQHTMFQYRAGSNMPRPESFCADVRLVRQLTKPAEKRRIWRDIASAAESGWDFSTRWMRNPERPNLLEIETTNVVPVDLNAFICGNYELLAHLFLQLGNHTKFLEYQNRHYEFRDTFQSVFFVQHDAHTAGWYDYNLRTKAHNSHFYATLGVPLFMRCYHPFDRKLPELVFRTMQKAGVFKEPGGIPTSMIQSGQQWDYPNGWPPLNHMIIEGFRRSENIQMQKKAFLLASKWVLSNYRVFRANGKMWEKYAVNQGEPDKGNGGEYEVQAGFGWTNGVILDLLSTYGDRMAFNANNIETENLDEMAENIVGESTEALALTGAGMRQSSISITLIWIFSCFLRLYI